MLENNRETRVPISTIKLQCDDDAAGIRENKNKAGVIAPGRQVVFYRQGSYVTVLSGSLFFFFFRPRYLIEVCFEMAFRVPTFIAPMNGSDLFLLGVYQTLIIVLTTKHKHFDEKKILLKRGKKITRCNFEITVARKITMAARNSY